MLDFWNCKIVKMWKKYDLVIMPFSHFNIRCSTFACHLLVSWNDFPSTNFGGISSPIYRLVSQES